MYEYLTRNNFIKYNAEQVHKNYIKAVNLKLAQLKAIKENPANYAKNPSVIITTKALCVDDWFAELKAKNINIEEILQGSKLEVNKV